MIYGIVGKKTCQILPSVCLRK